MTAAFFQNNRKMRFFSKKLTGKDIANLESFANAILLSAELTDAFIAFHEAKLTDYGSDEKSKEGMKERWGIRVAKRNNELSFIMHMVNGMANKIEEQKAMIEKLQEDAKGNRKR
jgi:hypothetical protein